MRNQVAQELCAFEPRDGCGYCRRALGAEVRIECAECTPRLLLCVDCLRAGVSIHTRGHTPAHKYRVIDVGSDALLEIGWRGTDELRLLEGVQLYGFGNWMDIAEHVGGGRSREAVERHYRRCYLESPHFPTPHFEGLEGGGAAEGEGGAADGSAAKRRRTDSDAVPAAPPPDTAAGADSGGADGAGSSGGVPGPDPSEVGPRPPEEEFRYQGWMPLRQEFDAEWEDEAEALVSEIEFVPGELEAVEAGVASTETREKMQKLHTYNATLDGRQWRHELVVARDLLDDVHEQIEIERIAPVAEVAARARLRPLARFHSAAQHEELVQSVLKQQGMALDLRHLQAAAAKGITSLREAEASRPPRPPPARLPAGLGKGSQGKGTGHRKVAGASRTARRAAAAEDDAAERGAAAAAEVAAAAAASARAEAPSLLSSEEAELCERLALPRHLLPRAKRQLVLAALAGGGLARREAAAVLRPEVDTARAAMLWDYCVGAGWVQPPAAEAGGSGAA